MAAKPIKSLELHYTMNQFLRKGYMAYLNTDNCMYWIALSNLQTIGMTQVDKVYPLENELSEWVGPTLWTTGTWLEIQAMRSTISCARKDTPFNSWYYNCLIKVWSKVFSSPLHHNLQQYKTTSFTNKQKHSQLLYHWLAETQIWRMTHVGSGLRRHRLMNLGCDSWWSSVESQCNSTKNDYLDADNNQTVQFNSRIMFLLRCKNGKISIINII